jgi:integrase
MPRGQKPGWAGRRKPKVERPRKPVRKETGIWLYPSGKFGVFIYDEQKSVFLGLVDSLEEARANRAIEKMRRKLGPKRAPQAAMSVTLQCFFEKVFAPDAYAGRKDSTKRCAMSRFRTHIAEPLGGRLISEIDYTLCARFRSTLVDRQDRSGTTKREVLMLLRHILREAVRHGIITANPAALLELPGKGKRKVQVPELAVVQRVIARVHHPVARMFAELLVRTGLRTGEAAALKWDDLDLEGRKLHVRRTIDPATGEITSPKTDESFRTIDIPQSLADLLAAYRDENGEDAWLFPSAGDAPLDGRNFVQRYWEPAIKKAEAPHINPHALRHLFASHLLQQGAEILYVANQLGHTSAAFTLYQYGHLLRDSSPSRAKLEGAFPATGGTVVAPVPGLAPAHGSPSHH